MDWLFKEEPTHYSFDDLVRDGSTRWTGVKNPLARKHLREVRKGDRILYYHTGKEKAVVGIARAISDARPDPKDRTGGVLVEIAPVGRLPVPVPLKDIKARSAFASFPLVRMPRLSVMPVGTREWSDIETMSRAAPPASS
jgi:predicted RNA-binding protein with PUA-like domain